jgi:hypothetical protein
MGTAAVTRQADGDGAKVGFARGERNIRNYN